MLHHVAIGKGRPVVVLHGGMLDHRHMVDALEPAFEGTDGWRRIYIDLPGHGQSGTEPSIRTQDDVLERVIAYIETVVPDDAFTVIGESRGAYIAQGIARCRPARVDGLALIVPGGISAAARATLPDHRTLVPDAACREELGGEEARRFDRLVVQNPDILEKIRRTKIPAAALHDAALEARLRDAFAFSFDAGSPDAVFDKPSLIISGRQDSIAGYRDTLDSLEAYPRATFALLDTAGHSLAWERPALFSALVRDWLIRLSDTDRG